MLRVTRTCTVLTDGLVFSDQLLDVLVLDLLCLRLVLLLVEHIRVTAAECEAFAANARPSGVISCLDRNRPVNFVHAEIVDDVFSSDEAVE